MLNREFNSISQAALLLGFFAFLSQILGLFRDRGLASILGPSSTLDIYYAAFRIPDLLYVTIASFFAITALLPFLTARSKDGDEVKAREFFNSVFSIFMIGLIGVSIILLILMPYIAPLIVPGFSGEELKDLILISRIMLLSPIFMGISNLFGSVTQMYRRFFVYALSPIFYNIGILVGVFILYPAFGISGLAFGVILGAFLHALIQLPVIIRHRFVPKFTIKFRWSEIRPLIALSLPRTIGLATTNISIIAIVAMASLIGEGSISVFQFSYNLQNVPLILIGLSYSVAAFPTLSRLFNENNIKLFIEEIKNAGRQIIFWSLPVVFLFIVLRAQIVRVVLGTGNFDWSDTRLVAASLALFSISVLAQSLLLLLVRGYYAAGRTWRPLLINVATTGVTIIMAFLLLWAFDHFIYFRYFIESLLRVDDLSSTSVLMLPLAFSTGLIVNFIWLWFAFRKDFPLIQKSGLARTFFQSLGGSFIMASVAYKSLQFFDNIFDINTFFGIFLQGFLSGILGIIAGIIVLRLMKNKELSDVSKALRSKFWKTPVIQEAQIEL